jgi:hypothetical protein
LLGRWLLIGDESRNPWQGVEIGFTMVFMGSGVRIDTLFLRLREEKRLAQVAVRLGTLPNKFFDLAVEWRGIAM